MLDRKRIFLPVVLLIRFFIPEVESVSFNAYPYLYFDEKGNNASFPVREHIAPKGDKNLKSDHPYYLYNPKPGTYRVVEFYVHWCNICRHFSKHYVKYAQKVQQLVADKDLTVTFHAISCVPNKFICQNQAIPGYPLVKVFKPGDTKGVVMKHTEVKPIAILQKLGINVDGMNDEDDADLDEPTPGASSNGVVLSWWDALSNHVQGVRAMERQGHQANYRRTRENLKNDIHLAFDFAMRNNVYISEGDDPLSKSAKKALKAWFILMDRTLPPSWTDLHALLVQLIRNFRYVSKKEPYLIKFLDRYPPKALSNGGDPEWSLSCSQGVPGRGFTCGLWEMFHAVTVGSVDFNKNQVEDAALLAPETVAMTIRDFIEFFFSCEECRQNFIKMYDSCAFNRCKRLSNVTKLTGDEDSILEWEEVPLWLYEVHNAVNVRLMIEKATREKREPTRQNIIEAQWPARRECRPCWLEPDVNGMAKWNNTVVYRYLPLEYGQRDSAVVEFQRQLVEANSGPNEKDQSGGPGGPTVNESRFPHRFVLFVCIVGYASLTGSGNVYLRRTLFRKKVRTL
jgi:Erv1 / Alr family/Thioredoxin